MSRALTGTPRIDSRVGFLYVERCAVSRKGNALVLRRESGDVTVPLKQFNTLLLAPGVSVTHSAVGLLSSAGVSAVWVGDGAGVWYANGAPLSRSNSLLVRQAQIVSDPELRHEAAKRLYRLRFGNDSSVVDAGSIEDMQRAEAVEMKRLYGVLSKMYGVPWAGRDPRGGDTVNSAMTLGHSCLYSVCHSVIHALNLSTGLGVVHMGNYRAFTLDIADLYKHRITIPAAFDLAADVGGFGSVSAATVRARMREDMLSANFLRAVVGDIMVVLGLSRDSRDVTLTDSNKWWS